MTPKQVALVQDSFAKVALTSDATAVLFYDRLFDIAPQMKAMFPDDMIEQRRKLMAMLAGVVKGLGNLEQVLPAASAPVWVTDAASVIEASATAPSVPVIVERSAPGIEVELIGGRRVRFERDADPEMIRRTVALLEGSTP